jgi:hypothetical protein
VGGRLWLRQYLIAHWQLGACCRRRAWLLPRQQATPLAMASEQGTPQLRRLSAYVLRRAAVYIVPAALSVRATCRARSPCRHPASLTLLHASSQHFGPNIGISVVDNLFGLMQGSKAIVLANQKLWWMTAAAKYR